MPNKMSMEEKKKAEKLVLDQLESAEEKSNGSRSARRELLVNELEANPSKQAAILHQQILKAQETKRKSTEELSALGYQLEGYDDLRLGVNSDHSDLKEFDEESRKCRDDLRQLRRSFIIRIYSEGGGIEAVLKDLADEFKKLAE